MRATTLIHSRLHGIIPPLVTPLTDSGHIDTVGTERLVEHVIAGGVHGIFALGTTGEGTSIHPRMRQQFVEMICESVQRRVPVLVCITDTVFAAAMELAELSYGAGAAAVVTAAPYFLPMTQDDLCRYTETLADRLPLPLFLYNMPSCTKTAFDVQTVVQLAQHPNVLGLKDSSGDLGYFGEVAQRTARMDDFTLLVGPEELLLQSLRLGGSGGVNGGANVFPSLYVAVYEAATHGRDAEALRVDAVLQRVSQRLYAVSSSGARVIQGIKTALDVLGICQGTMAQPFRSYDDREYEVIAAGVAELAPLIDQLDLQPTGKASA